MNNIRVCLLDFDGTLVTDDILGLLCGLVGKQEESQKINDAFIRGELEPLSSLVERINLITGITRFQIMDLLSKNNYLMPGANELIQFLKGNKIITILASGNILSVLEYYQKLLVIDYIVGSNPDILKEKIVGITEFSYSGPQFKIDGIKKIIDPMKLEKENIIAIGDSPADKGMFELSGFSIAFNPKGNIADFADIVIKDDLSRIINILQNKKIYRL